MITNKTNLKNFFSSVKVFPGFNAYRYSFYMQGLRNIFGKEKIKLSSSGFPKFHHHAFPVILGENPGAKIYISAGDGPGYNNEALEWCDVYVKSTLLAEFVPARFAHKIIPAGPNQGIQIWNLPNSVLQALRAYFESPSCIENKKDHFWYYIKQYWHRVPEKDFIPEKPISNYVFYASTLYPKHPNYNQFRATFIRACQSFPDIKFEGGLIREDNFRVKEFMDITIDTYYPVKKWIEKVKRSSLGFWAPGDQGAMTRKLAEFTALGKAIIAVPIRQEQLPSPLVHGEHVHFVDGSLEEMKAAVRLLTTDHTYRQNLERNARKYYEEWVAPAQAMRRFIREGCQRVGIPCWDF